MPQKILKRKKGNIQYRNIWIYALKCITKFISASIWKLANEGHIGLFQTSISVWPHVKISSQDMFGLRYGVFYQIACQHLPHSVIHEYPAASIYRGMLQWRVNIFEKWGKNKNTRNSCYTLKHKISLIYYYLANAKSFSQAVASWSTVWRVTSLPLSLCWGSINLKQPMFMSLKKDFPFCYSFFIGSTFVFSYSSNLLGVQ